ncbi:hypothetical protein X989_1378 [Burkholderia pseudomallei MSHR4378]|nr:hypothetical protein X989_1378 [Burkholderia pseudomallei MSHR4378]
MPSMKPPHLLFVLPASCCGSPRYARQSQRSAGISPMQSRPSNRLRPNSATSRAPGKRPLMPMIATSSSAAGRAPRPACHAPPGCGAGWSGGVDAAGSMRGIGGATGSNPALNPTSGSGAGAAPFPGSTSALSAASGRGAHSAAPSAPGAADASAKRAA